MQTNTFASPLCPPSNNTPKKMYNRVSVSKRERTREREREPEREREREPERERESERERDTNQYGPVPWNGLINSTQFLESEPVTSKHKRE